MKSSLSFTLLSNVTLVLYFDSLLKEYFNKYMITVHYVKYGEHNESLQKEIISNSDFVIVWMNYEELTNDFKLLKREDLINRVYKISIELLNDVKQTYGKKIIWIQYEDYYQNNVIPMGVEYEGLIDQLNLSLYEKQKDEVVCLDLKRMIAELGIQQAFDFKSKYKWNAPYSKSMIEKVVEQIHKKFLIEHNCSKKCLVLDCDNVLWDGILSEDGMENIKLGSSGVGKKHRDFQKFILQLYNHGVILTICSKNDIEDVLCMFRKHTEMVIKEEHVAVFKVNWESKVDNIMAISNELNIGLDSMVFVDDSDFEIQSIKYMLPEVKTILFDNKNFYHQFSCFNLRKNLQINEIIKRNKTYQTNNLRNELLKQSCNMSEYLNALEMKIDIHKAELLEVNRISELTLRTNKLTNGRRYTVEEIKKKYDNSQYMLFSLYLSDRFSNLGLVGSLGIDGDSDMLDLISLSCRAMGRNIEQELFQFALNKHAKKAYCFMTGKNDEFIKMLKEYFEIVNLSISC